VKVKNLSFGELRRSIAYNVQAYKTFCRSVSEGKCAEGRGTTATSLYAVLGVVLKRLFELILTI